MKESSFMEKDDAASSSAKSSADTHYISDSIKVIIIDLKKGNMFKKHREYEITSVKHKSKVERRYNDFYQLHSQLLTKYSNRLILNLPPKQLIVDSNLLEERRCGLEKWLRLMSHHPLFSVDSIFKCFLTETSAGYLSVMTGELAKNNDEFLQIPITTHLPLYEYEKLASSRENMAIMLNLVVKLKQLINQQAIREEQQSEDFNEVANILYVISSVIRDKSFEDFSSSFIEIAKENGKASNNQEGTVDERLDTVADMLVAFSEMCDRIEKNINKENQTLAKALMNMNREKIRNAIRGTAKVEQKPSRPSSSQQRTEIDPVNRRNSFAIFCLEQETIFIKKYLKLLPSILLQFSHEKARSFGIISEIFKNIVQIESDKLN